MTPEEIAADMAEICRRKLPKREDVDPEIRKETEEAIRYMNEKIARGEVLKSWSKENFPIGLDKNMEPFPLTSSDQKGKDDESK
ncbi:hypothetical protein SAMN05421805_10119 [Saccharopolyspora antimicrobica]|uniref:Uncharacterized protein n=1 Tax=Saccharopolyspora antimicrobica TaxID=455193 RepID=A0A1I4Q943_9PSEU|nr:hypothetical protein [Saccharopolyspora antimicrobica]RKT84829.1 hypothetical protein ATL45_3157 [Saccharopolyspora antimicrobica]SFM36621.1 hypothetical protein SAMN05421805_10119 [Saccharopolyspora antimicrobica]